MGLEAYASDLNPVAVLINKSMIEFPPKFANKPPVNPEARKNIGHSGSWNGASGLAEDMRYYGDWMRIEAERRIGYLYPKVEITPELAKDRPDLKPLVGQKLTVIAYLWARTVKSPNPAFAEVDVPLASSFLLSSKPGKEVYVDPIIEERTYRFSVKIGKPHDVHLANNGTKVGRGGNFRCMLSGTPIPVDYIRKQGIAGKLGQRLMAVVLDSKAGRIYLGPDSFDSSVINVLPNWTPDQEINNNPRDIRTQLYGLTKYSDLFTPRQLNALTTFSDLISESRELIKQSANAAGLTIDSYNIDDDGNSAAAYADAISVYLACAISKLSDYNSTLCSWISGGQTMRKILLGDRQCRWYGTMQKLILLQNQLVVSVAA